MMRSWESDVHLRLSELERQVKNLLTPAKIAAVQTDPYLARVDYGSAGQAVLSDWLPIMTPRAGSVTVWLPVSIGESVLVLRPHGDEAQAIIVPAFFNKAPAHSLSQVIITYAGGSLAIDTASGAITATGNLTINGTLTITDAVRAQQSVSIAGDMTTDSKGSFNDHKHEYQMPEHPVGDAKTSEPKQ